MGEYDGKKWITAFSLLTILLITAAIVLALLVTGNSGVYAPKFDSTTVGVSGETGTLTRFSGATLYPYSGQWDYVHVAQTLDQCLTTCLGDVTCRGFFHHNKLSDVGSQDSCYFYRNNNVQQTIGTNVEFSSYFVDTALVFGAQLPGSSTDTYIKEGQTFKMFRSVFDQTGMPNV